MNGATTFFGLGCLEVGVDSISFVDTGRKKRDDVVDVRRPETRRARATREAINVRLSDSTPFVLNRSL